MWVRGLFEQSGVLVALERVVLFTCQEDGYGCEDAGSVWAFLGGCSPFCLGESLIGAIRSSD
jgi:hypothetical protein